MKYFIITLLFTTSLLAIDIDNLVKAHNESVNAYKKGDNQKAIKLLEDVGMKEILEKKPTNLSEEGYINILNNYGFFLSETNDRFSEAIAILTRVLNFSPQRFTAFINLGDSYNKLYQQTKEKKYIHKIMFYYENYLLFVDKNLQIPKRVLDFVDQNVTFPPLLENIIQKVINKKYKIQTINNSSCKVLLKDLLKHKRFIVLKPDIISNSYDDKKLKNSLLNCYKFDLNYNVKDTSMLTYISYAEFLEDKKKSFQFSEAKWDFRLYQDIKIDKKAKEKMIFYAGGFCPYEECKDYLNSKKFTDKIYFLVDNECEKNYKNEEKFNPLLYNSTVSKDIPFIIRDNKTGKIDNSIDEVEFAQYKGKYYLYRISTTKDGINSSDEFYSMFITNPFDNNKNECNLIEFEIDKKN